MKTIRIISLLLLCTISLSSCNWLFGHEDPEYDSVAYRLVLGFRDASGKDLVEGIGLNNSQWENVDPDLYELKVIRSGSLEEKPFRLRMERYGGYCCLYFHFSWVVEDGKDKEQLTYRLRCPYVFGDNAMHELTTHWDIPKEKATSNAYFALCTRIEFEGNEIIPEKCDDEYKKYRAVITLDR